MMAELADLVRQVDIRFEVDGIPQPQGSHKSVPTGQHFSQRTGKVERTHRIIDSNKNLPAWRSRVVSAAVRAMEGRPPFNGDVLALLWFAFPYRKADIGADGSVKASAPRYKNTNPDIDKLERAVLDALKEAGAVVDDGRVVGVLKFKVHALRPCVVVALRELPRC